MKCVKTPKYIGTTGNKHSDYKYQTVSISFARCLPTEEQECLPIDRSRNYSWFQTSSLLLFTSEHRVMMNEVPSADDPAVGELTKETFIYSGYKKQLELKLDVGMFIRGSMQLQLNEVNLYDDHLLPAFYEST